jgi:uncharacterized membrane protein YphA (DoxX/SURF4 family)
MLSGSFFAIIKKHSDYAVAGLFGVMISQAIGYGLIFDSSFFLRNLSIAGGLIMLLADYYNSTKKKNIFAGIPSLNETDKSTYLQVSFLFYLSMFTKKYTKLYQLAGRILLVFLFLTFILNGELTALRLTVSLISFIGCIMVVVGFKAKMSAWLLVAFLSVSNFFLNNWWSLHQ